MISSTPGMVISVVGTVIMITLFLFEPIMRFASSPASFCVSPLSWPAFLCCFWATSASISLIVFWVSSIWSFSSASFLAGIAFCGSGS